ncbi:MAG: hypothetical protein WBC87_06340, partial [Pseudolabrys sp.]
LWLIHTIERFPKSHKFVFGDRIREQCGGLCGCTIGARSSTFLVNPFPLPELMRWFAHSRK